MVPSAVGPAPSVYASDFFLLESSNYAYWRLLAA